MRQIIVDFGTLDVSAYADPLRLCAYAAMAALGLLLGQLAPWRFVQSGQDPRPLLRWAACALGGELLLLGLAMLVRGVPLRPCGYLVAFTVAFLVGLVPALRRLRKAAERFRSAARDAGRRAPPRLTVLGPRLLAGLSVAVFLAAIALLAADAIGYTASPRFYGYGLMLVLGFLSGVYLAQWRGRRAGESPEAVAACGALALIGGVVGARAAYVVENWGRFAAQKNFLPAVLDVTSGGLIYYGGVVLAAVMVLGYLRANRLPIRRYLDILAPSLMVGLAFGRAGCLLNGCCWGARCRADWALRTRFPMYSKPLVKLDGRDNPFSEGAGPSPVYAAQMEPNRHGGAGLRPPAELLDDARRLIPPGEFTPRQVAVAAAQMSRPVKPAQLLGMANAFVLAALLVAFGRLRRREGQVFAGLMIAYPATRFILEWIRADNPQGSANLVLTHNQYSSLVIMAAGLVFWWVLWKFPASAGPAWAQRHAGTASAARGGRSAGKKARHSKSDRKGKN